MTKAFMFAYMTRLCPSLLRDDIDLESAVDSMNKAYQMNGFILGKDRYENAVKYLCSISKIEKLPQ